MKAHPKYRAELIKMFRAAADALESGVPLEYFHGAEAVDESTGRTLSIIAATHGKTYEAGRGWAQVKWEPVKGIRNKEKEEMK